MVVTNKIELLSPVGNFESLEAAIYYGADSIYFGLDQLNMRFKSAKNFQITDINEIVKKCQKQNIKTYVTLNTIIYDKDLKLLKFILNQIKYLKIDGIIAMDHSVINYARKLDISVHISTQLNISNYEAIKFYSKYAEAIVLSRELSLAQLKKLIAKIKTNQITNPNGKLIKIEVFVHGAFCMAISGKCYLSLHLKNSSANRGACTQNCRQKYYLVDKQTGKSIDVSNEYLLSSKDLCTISFLDKIINTGINILKIEGRARSTEYVATATDCYRQAIDSIQNNTYTNKKINTWLKRLHNVYNRGFWEGYYLGKNNLFPTIKNSSIKFGKCEIRSYNESRSYKKKRYIGKVKYYFQKTNIGLFKIESDKLELKDSIFILGNTTTIIKTSVKSIRINNIRRKLVGKGQFCTIPIKCYIKRDDKLYKIIKRI
ncbi:peptidase U32 family protein [Candidatus Karelsulcia muelleri]